MANMRQITSNPEGRVLHSLMTVPVQYR